MERALHFDVNYVVQSLGLDLENVLNVYCFGSRLYGSHTNQSDYDFRIVCAAYDGTNNLF
jgi:predicted nucleotidyltransferase